MKVLSIKQPWASLIINGYKEYEFRSWKTNIRGTILIHASKSVDKEALKRFHSLPLTYPTGVILGSVTITDCIPVTEDFEKALLQQNELVYGATKNRSGYAFELQTIVKFPVPIEAQGRLGFWEFPIEEDETRRSRIWHVV